MITIPHLLNQIKENEIKFADLRFTDSRGRLHHMTIDEALVDENLFENGMLFDGSSIDGWCDIHNSDMILMPDINTAHIDSFFAQSTIVLFCNIIDPKTGKYYNKDPRSVAQKAEAYLKTTDIGDTIYVGPEAEFFLFDNIQFTTEPNEMSFKLDSIELPANNGKKYDVGNLSHRPKAKGGYAPLSPVDTGQDIRSEMITILKEMGVTVEKHHHEVAPAQHELGIKFDNLSRIADKLQIHKYVVHQVANAYGKTATFMPKPLYKDNGSGMHVNMSIWKQDKPIFAGDKYAGLSQECLYFIGGIIKHAKALNAFTNASTNSYKRLVPGYEAPVLLAYSASNRSASCRIPFSNSDKEKRVEVRFPDSTANPYLAFAALLMAGLDGIKNKIHPGEPMDMDLYKLPKEELKNIATVATSLREALNALDQDREFLKVGNVFDDDIIDSFINLKMQEVEQFEMAPHPIEFELYYSL
ncbi:type I glutamate--ammonia ligase [Bartonella sp. DGB1]|uniref:type I glutamate--ammonia ligase n=1 Tax=Bartonella sp. DGB1 TaxID=3239807 RepID=UPI003523484C